MCSNGTTPILLASTLGHMDAVKSLLSYDADFTIADHEGSTILHLAAANGQFQLCEVSSI